MRLNPFAGHGRHGQSPQELRAENALLTAQLADRGERLKAADTLIAAVAEERDWFHDRWQAMGRRAIDAETVAACLESQLAAAVRKVTDLEVIAGPHRDPSGEASPIYSEVTQEIGLPDSETTLNIPVMSLVALGART